MKANHLAMILPAKKLPQNTRQAYMAVWSETSRLLLRDMGKLYASFHPAARPWGVEIRTPFGVVLGWNDPALFLSLFFRARRKREMSIEYHLGGTLAATGFDNLRMVGDTLICPVTLDGKDKLLEAHIFWQAALASGAILPDCGVYYAERGRSTVEMGLEKTIESDPAGYALCVATLEHMEGHHGI